MFAAHQQIELFLEQHLGTWEHGRRLFWKPLFGLCKTCAAFACKGGPGSVAAFVLLVWTEPGLYEINKGEHSREKLGICLSLALPFQRGKLKSTTPSAVRRKIVLSKLSPTALVNTPPRVTHHHCGWERPGNPPGHTDPHPQQN